MAALLAAPLLGGAGARRMDAGDLADALMLPPGPVGEMLELFRANDLLVQSAEDGSYVLGRSPERLALLDLLRLVRHDALGPLDPAAETTGALARALTERLGARTVEELVGRPIDQIQTFSL